MTDDLVKRLRETSDDWPACLVALEQEAADRIEELQSKVNTMRVAFKYSDKIRVACIEKLEKSLRDCVNAIAEWERQPAGIEPFLLGALDNARKALEEKDD
jgi:hypothetical protein